MDIETGTDTERGADGVPDGAGLPAHEAWQPRADARWSPTPPPYPAASSAPAPSDPVLDAVAALRAEMVGEMRAVRREFIAALGVWSPPVDAAAESAAAEVRALGADLHRGLETLLDCVRDVTTAMGASSAGRGSDPEPVAAAVQEARDALLDRLEAQHAATRARLAELAALTQAGTAATRATQERLAALTEATDDLRDAVEQRSASEALELPVRLPVPYGRTGDDDQALEDDHDDLEHDDHEHEHELEHDVQQDPALDDELDDEHDDQHDDASEALRAGDLDEEAGDQDSRPLPAVDLVDEQEAPTAADRARSRAAQVAPARPSRPSWSYEPDGPSTTRPSSGERPAPPPPRSAWAPAQERLDTADDLDAQDDADLDDDLEDLGDAPARGRWFRSRD